MGGIGQAVLPFLRAHKPAVQEVLNRVLNDLRAFELDPRGPRKDCVQRARGCLGYQRTRGATEPRSAFMLVNPDKSVE